MNRLSAGLLAAGLLAGTAVAADAPQTQFINQQIQAGYKAAEIKKPAGKATDHEFLRRAFLDLIGRIATPEEVLDFEQDRSPDKRGRLVKRLLYESKYQPKVHGAPAKGPDGKPLVFDYADEYAGHWADLWTVWLMSRTTHEKYREQMNVWLRVAFGENRSYRDMVVQLLTATGKTNDNGAVNFILHHLGDPTPRDKQAELGPFDAVPITSRVTRLFLGLQTQCTQCHDHPFNKEWVQADFWGVNAFFRQTVRSGNPTSRLVPNNANQMALAVVELSDSAVANSSGIVFYERRDGKLMAAKPNFLKDLAQAERGEEPSKTMAAFPGKTRRQVLAEYVVSHDNFARAYVNRIWGHLFGRGLNKEPAVDDFGSHNEVVHPELLNKLADEFVKYGYNPKLLLEWICTSDPYELSHVAVKEYADPKYDPYFARMPLKALPPEVLFESLMTATKADTRKGDARKIRDAREAWLAKLVRNFGDDEGNEMTFNGTIIQALLMMNGRELNEEIGPKGANTVQKVVEKHSKGGGTNAGAVLDELFLMTLNRHPTGEEKSKILAVQHSGAVVKGEAPKAPVPAPKNPKNPKNPPPKNPKQPAATATVFVAPTSAGDVSFYQDVFWALLNTNEFMLNH